MACACDVYSLLGVWGLACLQGTRPEACVWRRGGTFLLSNFSLTSSSTMFSATSLAFSFNERAKRGPVNRGTEVTERAADPRDRTTAFAERRSQWDVAQT